MYATNDKKVVFFCQKRKVSLVYLINNYYIIKHNLISIEQIFVDPLKIEL